MNTLKEYFDTLSYYRIKPVNKATNTNIADKKLNKEDKKKSKKKTDLDFATLVQQETNKLKGIKEEMSGEANALSCLKFYHLPIKKNHNETFYDLEHSKQDSKEQKRKEKKIEKNKKKANKEFKKWAKKEGLDISNLKEETFKKELSQEAKKKRKDRREEFNETLINNYYNTFIKSVEKAANKKFKNDKIKKIELEYALNRVTRVKIYDHNDNLIRDEKLEAKIMKYAENKKEANDHNSDVRFNERKKSNMHDNLLNRSLGEENYFNY